MISHSVVVESRQEGRVRVGSMGWVRVQLLGNSIADSRKFIEDIVPLRRRSGSGLRFGGR